MRRASESIATLGAALAKAQAELVNPEKSMTATVRSAGSVADGQEQTFRYAPLSSGLEIVRKTLGRHEIATVQTTAIDQTSGLINLTTTLLHASGEWIASDWPVCPVADTASPRRMGAALTYARRYALFTLVGIAGEDDLDAPDLQDTTHGKEPAPSNGGALNGAGPGQPAVNSSASTTLRSFPGGNGRGGRRPKRPAPVVLAPSESAAVRDRLLGEVALLSSLKEAVTWAREALPAKNKLNAADAQSLGAALECRLAEIAPSHVGEALVGPPVGDRAFAAITNLGSDEVGKTDDTVVDRSSHGIDKSELALPEPKRHRNKEHLRFVARQPCLVCGRTPCDSHHVRFAQPQALGRKVSDEFVVPLCRTHHRALHRVGDERAWWENAKIDPLEVARKLWQKTQHGDSSARAAE